MNRRRTTILSRSARPAAVAESKATRKGKPPRKTKRAEPLRSINKRLTASHAEVLARAELNTLRLTGKPRA